MDSRERVFIALDFQEPDRVPVDFWASAGFYRALAGSKGETREAFLDRHDVDFRYIEGPSYIGPPLRSAVDGAETDIWGVPRTVVTVQTRFGEEAYQEVSRHPLAHATSADEIHAYSHWPSPDWFDYRSVRAQCLDIRNKGRVVVFMGDRLNRIAQLKPAMYLRGVEQIFRDLLDAPEVAEALFQHLGAFYAEYLSRILAAAGGMIDVVLTGDDFGSQNAPLVSPAMWERYFAAGFREYVRIIHDFRARSMHHTCGSVAAIVPAMVQCGLQVLQSLQPEAMAPDLPQLKRQYARRLAFQGGISIQQTMPHGSAEDICREVRERVGVLAPGGGYIFCTAHNIQTDCSFENVETLLRAYRREGRYRR